MPETTLRRRTDRLAPCGFALLLILLAGLWLPADAAESPRFFDSLEKKLIADGFDSERIKALFAARMSPLKKKGSAPISCTTSPS